MARVYVDTNILLDFYQSAHDPLGVFTELSERASRLVVTEQTLSEIKRNRAQRLSALIDAFSKSAAVRPHTTSLMTSLDEWKSLIDARDAFHEQAETVKRRLKAFLEEPDTDPVYTRFLELVRSKGVKLVETTDAIIARAHRRKLLGNPPSSPDKYTIGDEVIWESLLDGCVEDLVIVSRDNTFLAHETILREEYIERTGCRLLAVEKSLTSALKVVGADSSLIENEERDALLKYRHRRGIVETPPEIDARICLDNAIANAFFDYEARVIRVAGDNDDDPRYDSGVRIITSIDEFDSWAIDKAVEGYIMRAPHRLNALKTFEQGWWVAHAHDRARTNLKRLGWI